MKKEISDFDRVLIRIKDLLLVGGTIYGMFLVGFKFWGLPDRLNSINTAVAQEQKTNIDQDLKLAIFDSNMKYLVKSVDEIKSALKQ